MTVDVRLLAMLVCPVCKGPLHLRHDEGGRPLELLCGADRLAYPVRDGIPVMLENEARALAVEEEVK
ncbi:MAG TPA: Trm112 family protein [Ideonella sp.]|nr:Trm112 family protein [Ideonella sp.]